MLQTDEVRHAQSAGCQDARRDLPSGLSAMIRFVVSGASAQLARQPLLSGVQEKRMRLQVWTLNPYKQWRPQPASHCRQDAGTPQRLRGRNHSRQDAPAAMPTLAQSVLSKGKGRRAKRTRDATEASPARLPPGDMV
jgi:hypothetical protein